jgi:electron transfer flavoprotein alpha subunit
MASTLVVAELHEGHVRKSTHSAITFAKQLGAPFTILVVGANAKAAASDVTGFGAAKVLAADDASLKDYVCERFAPTVAAVATSGGFDTVVVTASSFGKDLAPRVAAKLGAGYAPDINQVTVDGVKRVYRRPMFAGNIYGTCEITTPVHVVSVRQTEFAPAEPSGGASAIEAKVIISGGRALKEKFAEVLDPLATLLGAAVGASRAACDAGYAPPELQVGQTGRVVAPQLYVAIGISGAIQHIAGMKGSKVIVAINKDAEAPIFQIADYGLVADLFVAVPELVAELKKG